MYTGGGKITGAWGVTGDGEYRGLKVRIHFKEIQPRARFQSDMGTVTGGYFYSGLYEGVEKLLVSGNYRYSFNYCNAKINSFSIFPDTPNEIYKRIFT